MSIIFSFERFYCSGKSILQILHSFFIYDRIPLFTFFAEYKRNYISGNLSFAMYSLLFFYLYDKYDGR